VGGGIYLNRSDFFSSVPLDNARFIRESSVPRRHLVTWLIVIFVIAVIALIAGYMTFGGANMGR
jgi:hypothetical protein